MQQLEGINSETCTYDLFMLVYIYYRYICMVTNVQETSPYCFLFNTVILEVVFPNDSFAGYFVNVTDPVTFECIAIGIPPPTIQWFRGDKLLTTAESSGGSRGSGSSGGSGEILVSADELISRLMLSEPSQMLMPTLMGNIYQVERSLTFTTIANDTDTYSCMASNKVKQTAAQIFTLLVQG